MDRKSRGEQVGEVVRALKAAGFPRFAIVVWDDEDKWVSIVDPAIDADRVAAVSLFWRKQADGFLEGERS